MDKNAIKKYAIWARRELIARVSQRAALYEITADGYGNEDAVSVHGRILSLVEKDQRKALIAQIKQKGFEQVMEEISYTWFNRFSALRFMEVNGYLPSHVRVFTDEENNFKPQIMTEAIHLEMDGLDMQKVFAFKDANDDDGLFKYLIITQCNALSSILPGMFQKISDYTELLFPDNLLREGSVVEQMVAMIPEEDWTDQVQIIGWLYQYYNTEPKDKVFANLKKNIKISKENIPAATQLFTPDWIVRYMVENSLGRLWIEGHPNDELKTSWKYYLEEAEQEEEVKKQLAEIRKEYATLKPEDIRCIDPCMGSGHILVYMFDVLVQIYESYGYTAREAASSIVENNIWGLDIDERAAQLAYFSVMMKARQYDSRFLSRNIQPHVYAVEESNGINTVSMHDVGLYLSQEECDEAGKQVMRFIEEMHDAKEYGSIIRVTPCDWDLLRRFVVHRDENGQIHLDIHGEIKASERLQNLFNIGETLAQKYDAVVTNPPYMGINGMGTKLSDYIKKNFPNTKSDMSTVFMEIAIDMCNPCGLMGMINIPVWMFLLSFEKLRNHLINKNTIVTLIHPGRGIFGSDFGTTSFVIWKKHISNYIGNYRRLYNQQGDVQSSEERERIFLSGTGTYKSNQDNFKKIPSMPIAYWAGSSILHVFDLQKLGDRAYPKQGLSTADNNRFLRLWFEVSLVKFNHTCRSSAEAVKSGAKWFPFNKGGDYRKWYGNFDYVINWENDGLELKNFKNAAIRNPKYYFLPHVTWSKVSIGNAAFRYRPAGSIFSDAGCAALFSEEEAMFALGLLNTSFTQKVFDLINPTVNYTQSTIASVPFVVTKKEEVLALVKENMLLCRQDWDSYETSWDFKMHPLVKGCNVWQTGDIVLLEDKYRQWEHECYDRYTKLKQNEERLNQIFIEIFEVHDEVSPDVLDKHVTVRQANTQREIRSLISYAVGCMFGRYTLGHSGIVFAGGQWDESKYTTFFPDNDAIIPICDDEYFEDDIVGRFVSFIEIAYGKATLEENLRFIAHVLGGNGSSREVIRNYFINDFYSDHCAMYSVTGAGKRPIYWLFDSGPKNGFKCLVYMHRYQPDTIARIRTDYVHEQQSRYRTAIIDLQNRIDNAGSNSERVKLAKKLKTVREQDEELRIYEEKIHHLADQMISIDLDDGVKVNYAKFQDVLAKIK